MALITSDCALLQVIGGILELVVPEGGGNGKALMLTAVGEVPDLSVYAIGVANNGGGTDGMEVGGLPAVSLTAGQVTSRLTAATIPMDNPCCSCKLTRQRAGQNFWIVRSPAALAAYYQLPDDHVLLAGTAGVDFVSGSGSSEVNFNGECCCSCCTHGKSSNTMGLITSGCAPFRR